MTIGRTESVLLVGLPATGKTSYLSLLFLSILEEFGSSIRLKGFADDREYLNGIARKLQSGTEADHTEVGRASGLELNVSLPDSSEGILSIPDRSGETWQEALTGRTWPRSVADSVSSSAGICFFVSASDFPNDATIVQANQAASALGFDNASMVPSGPRTAFDSSAQVQTVDLLQLLLDTTQKRVIRLSFIISAYDCAPTGVAPNAWVRANAPLLHQFIESNEDVLESSIFGVSAQGGSFKADDSRRELLAQDPVQRAFLKSGDGMEVPLDAPVLWSLALDG